MPASTLPTIEPAPLGNGKLEVEEYHAHLKRIRLAMLTVHTLQTAAHPDEEALKDVLYAIECSAYRMRMLLGPYLRSKPA